MYFPYQKGRYEVVPGLFPFPKDFGNGEIDSKFFQISQDYPIYRKQFLLNRLREPVEKYVCLSTSTTADGAKGISADPRAVGAICLWMAKKIAEEYPEHFSFDMLTGKFLSRLNQEELVFDFESNKVIVVTGDVPYVSAWDAIGAQAPEDFSIWRLCEEVASDGSAEYLEALHLNSPGHWSAQEKIGRDFSKVHRTVPHMEQILPWVKSLLEGVIERGPFTRFAWGVVTDNRLNHHPEPPPGISTHEWSRKSFNREKPQLFVRVERQVLVGFPELKRTLFFIRTYFDEVSEIKRVSPEAFGALIEAVAGMTPEGLAYKVITEDQSAILDWLKKI